MNGENQHWFENTETRTKFSKTKFIDMIRSSLK